MTIITDAWWKLVRFGFRLLYNELAFTYDWVSKAVSLGEWHGWQRAAIPFMELDEGLVLEIAHGTGDLQKDLQDAGFRTVAYDLSPYMGRIARRKTSAQGYQVDYVRGRAQQLPFVGNQFDAIVCTFPTSFILEGPVLAEAHRVLKPDGRFVIVLHGTLTGSGLLKRFLDFLYRVTGQSNTASVPIFSFSDVPGFDVMHHNVQLARSVAGVVVLKRR